MEIHPFDEQQQEFTLVLVSDSIHNACRFMPSLPFTAHPNNRGGSKQQCEASDEPRKHQGCSESTAGSYCFLSPETVTYVTARASAKAESAPLGHTKLSERSAISNIFLLFALVTEVTSCAGALP
jgi:hypothetical protein